MNAEAPRGARVGVVGATGYVGSELVRWLLQHPAVDEVRVTSRAHAGQPLAAAVPGLLGCADAVLEEPDLASLSRLDAVFLATPHGVARELAAGLERCPLVLDLSADHRHAPGWVYGQPEWRAEALAGATRVALPGCFATALLLSAAPLVAAGALAGPLSVVAATGSTGSGADPKPAAHHPVRFANVRAYRALTHQHVPEVRSFLEQIGGSAPELRFVPWSAPVDRGIFATTQADLRPGSDALSLFRDAYAGHPFIRFREDSPELRTVRGSPFADLSVHQDGDAVAVLCAIDNLGKGAASQAIQAFNAVLGLPPALGLRFIPPTP